MNELSKNLLCICIRNGVEIWLEKERAETLMNLLRGIRESKFIEISGQFVNTADIVGIFTPQTMEEFTRRKNKQWKCEYQKWHTKSEDACDCWKIEQNKLKAKEFEKRYGHEYPQFNKGKI